MHFKLLVTLASDSAEETMSGVNWQRVMLGSTGPYGVLSCRSVPRERVGVADDANVVG